MSTLPTKQNIFTIAKEIEQLAIEIQNKVINNQDLSATANELAKKNITFVFVLGEVAGIEEASPKKLQRKTKVLSNPNNTQVNRSYNRDSFGRFSSI